MKTVQQLNREAGEHIAFNWLRMAEKTLAGGRNPAPLTSYTKDEARINLVSEWFYDRAHAENKAWWVSDRNWKHISLAAVDHAKQVLMYIGATQYPLTLAHFTKPKSKSK